MAVKLARICTVVGATAVAVGLTACGPDAAPAGPPTATTSVAAPTTSAIAAPATSAELAKKTVAAITKATSVRVTGTGVMGGKPTSTNLAGSTDDSNGHHVAALDTGGVVEFILAGGNTYLKADEAFWKAQRLEDFGRPYLGKWLKSPAAKKVEGSTTVSHHLKSLIDSSAPELLAPAVETTTLDGKPVFVWTRSLGKEAGQVFVAADGSWLPVKASTRNEVFLYSDWNKVAPVSAPPADLVVDAGGLP